MINHNGITYKTTLLNGKFYATWTHNRRSERKSLRTEDEAVAELRLREFVDAIISASKPTVATVWAEKYSAAHGETLTRSKSVWKNLKPFFENTDASAISHDDLDAYIEDASSKRQRGTVRLEISMLFAALRHAEKRGRALCPAYDLPSASKPRTRHLTTEEEQAMKETATKVRSRTGQNTPSREEVWLMIALATGSRKSAILDLTWDRVNLTTCRIDLLPKGEEQSSKRRPTVRIPRSLADYLRDLPREGDKVVPTGKGTLDYWLGVIADEAGVEGFHPHVTRHTVATKLVSSGRPLFEVAKHLGCSVRVIENTYAHHSPDLGAACADILG